MAIQFLDHFKPLFEQWDNIVLFSGRGTGKSYHAAAACIWYARRAPVRILYLRQYASSNDQSTKAQLEIVINDMGISNEWVITNGEIAHKTTGAIIFFRGLAVKPDSVKSVPNIDLCVFEECEDASDHSVQILRPTIRKHNSKIIWVGNPRNRTNAVAQLFVENEPPPNTVIIRNTYLDNQFCSEKTKREAEDMRIKNHALYNHVYMGQYLDVGQCIMVRNINFTPSGVPSALDICVIGCDVARDGGDLTSLCVRRGKHIVHRENHATMDLDGLVQCLNGLGYRYKADYVVVDSTGHGAWVPDALKQAGMKVIGVNFASSARKDKEYHNRRTELYGLANDYFEAGGCIPSDATELRNQLLASYYTLDSDNRFQLLKKSEIRKQIGSSPDESDAFCLSLFTPDGHMFTKPGSAQNKFAALNQSASGAKWRN